MASILNNAELTAMDDLYYIDHQSEAVIEVWSCGRAFDNIGQLAGVSAEAWTQKPDVTAVIVRRVGPNDLALFEQPERLDAIYRARGGEAGKVLAGDVVRADGHVYLVFQPEERVNGRPGIRAGLELVPAAAVPAALRAA